jgi:hypothetical protein
MGSERVSENGGTSGTGGTIARVEAEIRTVLANRAEVEAALKCHPADTDLTRLRDRWHAILEELRDLQRLLARLGGGFDTDYYHRQRERGGGVIVTDGQHPVVEDRR